MKLKRQVGWAWLAVLVALPAPAGADAVRLASGLVYHSATVETFIDGWLGFRVTERLLSKKLADVAQITLDGADDFNAAEAARAAGQHDQAKRLYVKVKSSDRRPWLAALIATRLAASAPQSQPTKQPPPVTESATKPATPVPSPTTKPAPPAVNPPSTPEALAHLLHAGPPPPNYTGLTDEEKAARMGVYEHERQQWVQGLTAKGKQVTWVVKVFNVSRRRRSSQITIEGSSATRLGVNVHWPPEHKDALLKLNKGDMLTITGTISSWSKWATPFGAVTGRAYFHLQGISMKAGGKWAAESVFHEPFHIVFVVDGDRAMRRRYTPTASSLWNTIKKMTPKQSFCLIYSSRKGLLESSKGLVKGTTANVKAAQRFCSIRGAGIESGDSPADRLAAIERGLEVLSRAPKTGRRIMYLVMASNFPDDQAAQEKIRLWNEEVKAQIHTTTFSTSAGTIAQTLRKIATEHSGRFSVVE